ncbi:hypothetical protein TNCV_2732301 [Trichonephila clavipes]|nr:hypothetical protein TNCV_2732301 [Trichonephila clavipes]
MHNLQLIAAFPNQPQLQISSYVGRYPVGFFLTGKFPFIQPRRYLRPLMKGDLMQLGIFSIGVRSPVGPRPLLGYNL